MKILAITCLSIAALKLAVDVKHDVLSKPDTYDEVVLYKTTSTSLAAISILNRQDDTQGVIPDETFAMNASEAGLTEVALGKLAEQKAASKNVKDFGQMMVADHGKANEELKALAKRKGIILPTECTKCQEKISELDQLKGKDFDKKYIEMMVTGHKEVIAKFTTESSQGEDSDLKKWASDKLPTIKHHLTAAEGLKQ
jgi:putative membrane protein